MIEVERPTNQMTSQAGVNAFDHLPARDLHRKNGITEAGGVQIHKGR